MSPNRRRAHPVSAGWTEIADGIHVRRYPVFDVNVSLVVGGERALVVDTLSSERQAAEVAAEIGRITRKPLVVLNTHHHFDHAFGNHVFLPAEAWGHELCAKRLREVGASVRERLAAEMPESAAEYAETRIEPPGRTFALRADLDLGGRRVRLEHFGRGHTDNDVAAIVDDAAVVFAGDLVEESGPPSFGDAYPLDWPGTLERLLAQVRGPVVPGHGRPVDRGFVERQLGELAALAGLAREALGGARIEELAARAPFDRATASVALERALAQRESGAGP